MKTKFLIIILFLASMAFQAKAQSTTNPDTVCAESEVHYKIPNPTANSTFSWGIYNNEGTITFGVGSDSIRVEWDNTTGIDSLWVFETNIAGCKGDTAKLEVVRVAPPTAEFDNSILCYGESLQINFTGNVPYSLEYTLNGVSITKTGISKNPYALSEESGNYILLNVSSGQCSKTLSSGTLNATISEQLQPLQIFHE